MAALLILVLPNCLWGGDWTGHLADFAGHRVRLLAIDGNRVTRERIIRRELRTQVGRALDLGVLGEDLQRLDNLDIFAAIRADARLVDGGVALEIKVRELPFLVPYISYDVSDQDGWSFGPALKSVNMLGRDIYVAGFALFGGKNTFLLDVDNPWISGNHFSLDLTLSRIERDNTLDGFTETTLAATPWFGLYLGERGRLGFGLSYFEVESDRDGHTLNRGGRDRLVQLGFALGYDSRDAWGNPHRGWLNEIKLVRTGGQLPGDGDYWTLHLDGRRFQPLRQGHTLVLASLLSLQSGRVGRNIPEYMDFHLGGSNSIRGYQVDDLGRTLFGKNQLLTTLEYRFALLEARAYEFFGLPADLGLEGGIFADTGVAWNKGSQLRSGRFKSGWGLGLRVLMPAVDMVRLDVGFGSDLEPVFHFAVFSKLEAQRFRLR